MPLIQMWLKNIVSRIAGTPVLCLLFALSICASCMGTKKKKVNDGKHPVEYALTVAAIHPASATDQYIEVTFNESARFYRLPRNANPSWISLLEESQKNSTPVLVKRANEYSDIIIRVRKR